MLIAMVAAAAHALSGDAGKAASWAANVRERSPELTRADFFRAFPIQAGPTRTRIDRALEPLGFR